VTKIFEVQALVRGMSKDSEGWQEARGLTQRMGGGAGGHEG
jgi:hypothetical protein